MIIYVTATRVKDVIVFMRKTLNVQGRMLLALIGKNESGNEYRVFIQHHEGLQKTHTI